MNLPKTTDYLAVNEGLRTWAYKDTNGIWTTGIGYNLERNGADANLQAHGIDPAPIHAALLTTFVDHQGVTRTVDDVVTVDQAKALEADDIGAAVADLRTFVAGFDAMPDDAQMILIDLYYNLGSHELRGWTHTLGYAVAHNWKAMAAELVNNKVWVREVGARATRDANVLQAIA